MLLYLDLEKARKMLPPHPGQLSLFGAKPAPPTPEGKHEERVHVAAHVRETDHGPVQVPAHTRLVLVASPTPDPAHVAKARDAFERMSDAEEDDIAHAEGGRKVNHPRRAEARRRHDEASAEFNSYPRHVQDAAVRMSVDRKAVPMTGAKPAPAPGAAPLRPVEVEGQFDGPTTPAPAAKPFPAAFGEAFDRLRKEGRGTNLVSLHALRAAFPHLSREEFNRELHALRRSGQFLLETHESRHGRATPEQLAGAIEEGGRRFVYASRRESDEPATPAGDVYPMNEPDMLTPTERAERDRAVTKMAEAWEAKKRAQPTPADPISEGLARSRAETAAAKPATPVSGNELERAQAASERARAEPPKPVPDDWGARNPYKWQPGDPKSFRPKTPKAPKAPAPTGATPTPKKTGRPAAGTPTHLNASVLDDMLKEHGGRVPGRVEAGHHPHLNRTLKAGWIEKHPDGQGFRLTQKGAEGMRGHEIEPPANAVAHLGAKAEPAPPAPEPPPVASPLPAPKAPEPEAEPGPTTIGRYTVAKMPDGRWGIHVPTTGATGYTWLTNRSSDRAAILHTAHQLHERHEATQAEIASGGPLPEISATTKEAHAVRRADLGRSLPGWPASTYSPISDSMRKTWVGQVKAAARKSRDQLEKWKPRAEAALHDFERLHRAGQWHPSQGDPDEVRADLKRITQLQPLDAQAHIDKVEREVEEGRARFDRQFRR